MEQEKRAREGFDKIDFSERTSVVEFDFASREFEQAIGSSQDDIFTSDDNANNINGGAGQDTIDYSKADSFVVANLGTSRQSGSVASQGDVLSSIENIVGTGFRTYSLVLGLLMLSLAELERTRSTAVVA